MPNSFNDKYGFKGILENNFVYPNRTFGTFEAPTDWSIWLVYAKTNMMGSVEIKTWAEEYTINDVTKITEEWQPTGTRWIDTQ